MPVKRGKTKGIISVIALLGVIILDQLSKLFIAVNFSAGQSTPIIKNMLHLTFVRNTGAAFGLFKEGTVFFIGVSMLAVIFILSVIFRSIKRREFADNFAFNFGLILIMAGAIGNLIDRLYLGYVIDFIDVRIWPVFNIADSSITVGSVVLIISFLRKPASN